MSVLGVYEDNKMFLAKLGKPCTIGIASEGLIRTARRQKIKPDRKEREKRKRGIED